MNGSGVLGNERVMAAAVAVAGSTAMWQAGELCQAQYIDAVMVAGKLESGELALREGLRKLMAIWMGESGVVNAGQARRRVEMVNGYNAGAAGMAQVQ